MFFLQETTFGWGFLIRELCYVKKKESCKTEVKMKKFLLFFAVVLAFATLLLAAPPGGNSGAIWTTRGDCGDETKDANIYKIGDHIFLNGHQFDPGEYEWEIKGQPGNASCDHGDVVASGAFTISEEDSGGFCFEAYTVAEDDCGEYQVKFGNKGDNYRVELPPPPPNPAIDIEKLVQGEDADVPTGPVVTVGATVTFSFIITNIGDVPLTNIVVTDNIYGTITLPKTSLEAGESMTGSTTAMAVAGQHTNTATVTGNYEAQTVTDADPANYWGETMIEHHPGIDLEKLVQGEDADTPTGPNVTVGAMVTFQFVVTNTGDVPLTNIVVTDDVYGTITMPKSSLAVGESMTGSTAAVAVAGQHTNMATVTGNYETQTVTDQDPGNYWGETKRLPLGVHVECVDKYVFRDTYRVHFIVNNANPYEVQIGLGAFNNIAPIEYDGKQPTSFGPGKTEYFLEVPNDVLVSWFLDVDFAMASRNSEICKYAGTDDVVVAGIGVYKDVNTNGLYDVGEDWIEADDRGFMAEVYMINAWTGEVVGSHALSPTLFFRAGRYVNYSFRQKWGEFYILAKTKMPTPSGYRLYPNYRVVRTSEFPEPFYSLENDFGLVPESFEGPLDGPYLPMLAEYLPASATLAYRAQSQQAKGKLKTEEGIGIAALPTEFQLEQNYPNPFNPTTTIAYDLPASGQVTLKIYDVSGREVAALVNEQQPAGHYSVTWRADHLASGIYFYCLQAGSFSQTKRLVLTK